MPSSTDISSYDALIVGAGFSGLYQLHCLRDRLGLKVKVLERAADVGGTWYWNRYPGARCDSESHSYCYFFSEALLESWEWSERYPAQPEVLRYLGHVADRFDLRRDIQFETGVETVRYDDRDGLWTLETDAGERYRARFVIMAVGCLSSANVPDIPGLSDFEGAWYHTGQWPHEGVDFSGLRVGQIGTGSTGIQTAPVIAEQAAHLTVFQRTANYSVPAQNHPLTESFKAYVKANHREIRRMVRFTPNGHPFVASDRSALDSTPEERAAVFEAAWAIGGLRFRTAYRDITLDAAANETAADFIKRKIRETVKDPETARVLSDIDHPYAAKRPPIDTGYFETFNRDNVSLVDLRKTPIVRITGTGIETEAGHHDLDAIVFATGFDAMTGPLLRMDIRGRRGTRLADVWAEGPLSYLGLMVPGFPNLFTVTGPGSPSVLCNMPVPIEQHVEWITDCIAHLDRTGGAAIEARADAARDWGRQVNEAAYATVMPMAPHSWYFGANIPGKPRQFMPYAGGMRRYREICDAVAADGYRGFETLR